MSPTFNSLLLQCVSTVLCLFGMFDLTSVPLGAFVEASTQAVLLGHRCFLDSQQPTSVALHHELMCLAVAAS